MNRIKYHNDRYYHIYNRGVDKRDVFLEDRDYFRFLEAMELLNDKRDGLMIRWRDQKRNNPKTLFYDFLKETFRNKNRLVDIIAYCLNPNHYHIILKQRSEDGIRRFMHKIGTSHTKYFNEKNRRTGILFQGSFKSSPIKPNALLYVSAYVNCNCEVHGIAKAGNYRWCSFPEYLGKRNLSLCNKKVILDQFRNRKEYFNFAKENIKAQKQKKEDEKYLLE